MIGSTEIAAALLARDLVDELRLMIDPVMLGGGKRFFRDDGVCRRLGLVTSETTPTGAIGDNGTPDPARRVRIDHSASRALQPARDVTTPPTGISECVSRSSTVVPRRKKPEIRVTKEDDVDAPDICQ